MAVTVKLFAPAGVGGVVQASYSGTVTIGSDNTVSVDSRDVAALVAAGFAVGVPSTEFFTAGFPPLAPNAVVIVASVAASNGTLTIAAQPDTPRQLQALLIPGAAAVTAGTLTLTYAANDGTAAQVDVFSLVTALSTTLTMTSSKGCLVLSSAVIAGLVGGSSPAVEIGSNGVLAVPIPLGSQDCTLIKDIMDGAHAATQGTLGAATGLYTPHTAPNATHTYGVWYSTINPVV